MISEDESECQFLLYEIKGTVGSYWVGSGQQIDYYRCGIGGKTGWVVFS